MLIKALKLTQNNVLSNCDISFFSFLERLHDLQLGMKEHANCSRKNMKNFRDWEQEQNENRKHSSQEHCS